jgi:peptide/nickel transport system substrate-binding protein
VKTPVAAALLAPVLAVVLAASPPAAPDAAAQTPAQPAEVVVGKTFIAAGDDPARGSNGWALVSHGVAEQLFAVDETGRVVPRLAERAERTGERTWRVVLAGGRSFADGAPVTAEAVAEGLNRTVAENGAARASAGRLAFAAEDARTLLVETERPTPVLPSILAEWPMVVYRPTAAGPVFTGPWRIAAMTAGGEMRLEPNAHHPGAADRPPVRLRRFPDPAALALALEGGEVDLAFNLPAASLERLSRRRGLTVRSFPVAYQYMAWMNTSRAPLDDVRVRRAVDLALDRAQIARAVQGGEPATGAFAAQFPFATAGARPHDPAEAARLLDAAGWVPGLDGVRRRDGRPLRLVVYAYPQRPDLVAMQPVVRAQLRAAGIEAETRVTEQPTDLARAGDFDVLLWAQHTAPAGDPGFFLSVFLRSDGANNFARWSSPAFDAVLDRMAAEGDGEVRARLAGEAEALVFAEAPVAYLITPVWHVGLSARLAAYRPWGSDYYVIRADMPVSR